MEQKTDYLGLLQFGVRMNFMEAIARASREGRKTDAKLLARLALHLCHDAHAYPFEVREMEKLNGYDFPAAMEFISQQRGYTKSNYPEDADPASAFQRLIRYVHHEG